MYVLGSYGYNNSPPSGGVYRSTDGGATWKNLGYDLHPDFHAFAFQPNDTQHIAIGNDGGVWESHTGGGRNIAGAPLSTADWQDLNGQVNPNTAALIHSTGLALTQFTSMATVPNVPGQYWGGTQDNGTLRKSLANNRWFDQASGDGGQVIVDQSTANLLNPSVPAYVFGTYFGISPLSLWAKRDEHVLRQRAHRRRHRPQRPSRVLHPVGAEPRQRQSDVPRDVPGLPDRQRRGGQRGRCHVEPISPDLTSGCTGAASNGARGCLVSAIGVADGGDGVYAGTDEGWIQVSPDAVTAATPSWHRVGVGTLPDRPVNQIAVDRSNWRIAYAAYGGFAQATPGNSGHVFATTDGGAHWKNITHNLPDAPVNTIVLDPADAKTLYVGTDVGAFITTDGGENWSVLGTSLPKVAVWQLDYDASHGVLAAGTHGRGAYVLTNGTARPALIVSKADDGTPVGPGSTIHYTITVRNIGNAAATDVSVTDPIPANTSVVSIGSGGHHDGKTIHWDGKTIPAGGSLTLKFDARISPNFSGSKIVDDGIVVKNAKRDPDDGQSADHVHCTGSRSRGRAGSGVEAAKVGQSASFVEHLTNTGYQSDSYSVSASGGSWTSATYDATCTTPLAVTPLVAPGATLTSASRSMCRRTPPTTHTNDTTFTATSSADSAVTGSATLTTIAVATDTLLVDEDTNDPVDSAPYYEDALTANGVDYSYWDLAREPAVARASYLAAHTTSSGSPATPTRHRSVATRPSWRVPQRRRTAVDVGAGHPGPGRRHDVVREELPAHRLGRHRGPERQGDRERPRRERQPGHGRHRRGPDRPLGPERQRSRTRSPRSPRPRRLHGRHGRDRWAHRRRRATRSSSSRSRSRRTGLPPTRLT